MKDTFTHPADMICEIMTRIYQGNMTSLTGGNLSVIDDEGTVWVSPSGVDKASLTRDDIVQIRPDGTTVGRWQPTSEYRIHHAILTGGGYRAVLHAHPPAMVTMSILHDTSSIRLTPQVYRAIGRVGLAEYAMSGTEALARYVGQVFEEGISTAVLKNHATFMASQSGLLDAFLRFELFDFNARSELYANTLGRAEALSTEALDAYFASIQSTEPVAPAKRTARELELRRQLAELSRRAYRKQLFSGLFGCISARVEGDSFLISPADKDNAGIAPEDFILVRGSHSEGGGQPDESYAIHRAIYQKHPDIHSVILAAPVYATTFALCKQSMDVTIVPESYGVLRKSVTVPFEMVTHQKREVAGRLDADHPFAILENLGILLADVNPLLAFDKLEVAEFTAISIHQARISGKPLCPLTPEQLAEAAGH